MLTKEFPAIRVKVRVRVLPPVGEKTSALVPLPFVRRRTARIGLSLALDGGSLFLAGGD